MDLEAQAFWRDWNKGGHDVAGLRLHTIPLLEHMRRATQDEDWELVDRLLQTYSHVAEQCRDEPLLTTYENGLLYLSIFLADSLWVRGELRRALEHLDWVQLTLEGGDRRRVEHGMVPRPNSELRFKAIGIRAACLLEDPALFAASSPELETTMLAAEFWRLADAVVNYLQEKAAEDEDQASLLLHDLARWELETCKLCERYNPHFVDVAVDMFNARMGPHLEKPLRHFQAAEATDYRSAWYWDFELGKLETSGKFSRAEVLACDEHRRTAARLSYGKAADRSIYHPWNRQITRMLESAKL
jgi:hypothetical protein